MLNVKFFVVLNMALCVGTLCLGLIVPWASYHQEVGTAITGETIFIEEPIGLWRCYEVNCSTSKKPKNAYIVRLLSVIFLCLAVLFSLMAVMCENSRPINALRAIRIQITSFLLLLMAPLMYIILSFALSGSHLKEGVWVSLAAVCISAVFLVVECIYKVKEHRYTELPQRHNNKSSDDLNLES
mmetsp:Transcript_17189/g.25454  ORF Transcript_17189/g.25454 Transcript_17189/m.25454 type:complete len:184 (+) Transcript_17189:312-863(+)